jgi:hypothetical protein
MAPENLHDITMSAPSQPTGREPLLLRSLFWERTALSLLEKVERLPTNVQVEIATRVGNYIHFARTVRDQAKMTRFIEAAAEERAKVAQGEKFTINPRWTAPALAEAWCISRLGLSNGTLNPSSAMSITTAIEDFASERAPDSPQAPAGRDQALKTDQAASICSP